MADFDYISGNPDNLTGGGAANMVDIQGPLVDLKEWLNTDLQPRVAAAAPTLVATLPTGAVDGQEIYYQNATMATTGRRWHLVYRAGNPTAYKWEFVGGRPYVSAQVGSVAMASGGPTTIPGMSTFTAPLDGVYDFEFGAGLYQPNNSSMSRVDLYWSGAVQGQGARLSTVNAISTISDYNMVASVLSEASLTAGTVVELRYTTQGAGSLLYAPWMRMTAVRVG